MSKSARKPKFASADDCIRSVAGLVLPPTRVLHRRQMKAAALAAINQLERAAVAAVRAEFDAARRRLADEFAA